MGCLTKNPWARTNLRSVFFCGFVFLALTLPAAAKTTQEFVESARQYVTKGDLKSALIELRNAAHDSPQDATIHLRLAAIYLRLGSNEDAEREAKTASTLGSKESEYLPLLMGSLLREHKFDKLLNGIPAGQREPTLEAKVHEGRAFAYAGKGDKDKALQNLREAVQLDPGAPSPQLALARLLAATKAVDEANKIVDTLLANNPHLDAALQLKAQFLARSGDLDGAMKKLDEALGANPNDLSVHLFRASLYLSRGDTSSADKDLDPILAKYPNLPQANYLKALGLALQKKFADANAILTKISWTFPNLIEGFHLQGQIQYEMGQFEQAEENLTKYVARVPDSSQGVRLLAAIALKRGDPSRAINYLEPLAQKQPPPDASIVSLLGDAYLADGKPELALKQFQAAAELSPNNPKVETLQAIAQLDSGAGDQGLALLQNVYGSEAGAKVAGPVLVLMELRAGHAAKAHEVADGLIAKDGNNPVYQTLLGLVQFAQRDYKGAEASFKSAIARAPNFEPATQNLAQLYLTTGRRDDAKKVYQTVVAQNPTDVPALLTLADMSMADRNWDEANKYISRASSAAPNDPRPQIKLVDLDLMQKKTQDAKSVATGLLAPFPNDPNVLDAVARVEIANGDVAGGLATYQKALEVAPSSKVILARYLAILNSTKDYKTARDVLAQQVERQPDNVEVKLELIREEAAVGGVDAALTKTRQFAAATPNPAFDLVSAELLERAKRADEAIAMLEKATAEQPALSSLRSALAQAYTVAGQSDKAEALLKARLEKEPGDNDTRTALASLYLQLKRYDDSVHEYEQVAANAPLSIVALNNLAWLYQQKGDLVKARQMAERAVEIEPQSAAIEDTLGWIMSSQGDNDEALKYLKTAGGSSQDPEIQYHLAVALKRAGQNGDAKAVLEKILGSGHDFQSKSDAQKLLQQLSNG